MAQVPGSSWATLEGPTLHTSLHKAHRSVHTTDRVTRLPGSPCLLARVTLLDGLFFLHVNGHPRVTLLGGPPLSTRNTTKMAAPYKHGKHFRCAFPSKASTVKEDHSKSSEDDTRIPRKPDIDDIGGFFEDEPRNVKEPNVASAVILVNAQKRNGSSERDINHE